MIAGFRLFFDIAPIAFIFMIVAFAAAFPYRKEPAAQSLLAYIALTAWLLAMSLGELMAPAGTPTLTFAKLEYLSYLYIPVVWLSFCLRHSGWIRMTNRRVLSLVTIMPALGFVFVCLNDWHGLLWRAVGYHEADGFSTLNPVPGPFFWLYMVYAWSFIAFGTLVAIRSFFYGQKLYYSQSLWILTGAIIPGITNLLYVIAPIPNFTKDFTPIGYALSALCFLAGMYIHRLLWVMPVARSVLLQELNIGVLALDPNGWIVDHNRKADEMLGLPTVAIGHRGENYPALAQLFKAARFEPGVEQGFLTSGQLEWGASTINWNIQAPAPSARGIILVLEDVTKQSRLQKEIEKIRHELINREKLATVGRLTAGLAHEINNPVGYLKSDTRSLATIVERELGEKNDAVAKEIRSICSGITEGLDRVENVVRSLLAFSRQERIDSPFEPYDLRSGIETTLDIMRYEFHGTVGIKKDFGDIPPILAQKNDINQVILNLLTNACHAIHERASTESFTPLIAIRAGTDGSIVWCEIENNGAPISRENRDRVFDLFFTTRASEWGTGLGLNICREIVENRHGGKLTLTSIDPVIFRVELPIDNAKAGTGVRQ